MVEGVGSGLTENTLAQIGLLNNIGAGDNPFLSGWGRMGSLLVSDGNCF